MNIEYVLQTEIDRFWCWNFSEMPSKNGAKQRYYIWLIGDANLVWCPKIAKQ